MSHSSDSSHHESRELIRRQREQIARLRLRVERLERVIEALCGDPDAVWLYRNREERCDPSSTIFADDRGAFHKSRYQFASQFVAGKTVIDIACGTGYGSALLADQGDAVQVIGIDISTDAVDYATRRYQRPNTSFLVGSAEKIPLGDRVGDVVVSFETIEHVQDGDAVIREFFRILRPGGRLIISTPNQWPLDIAPFHTKVYCRSSFVELLQTCFSVEQLFNQNSGSDFPYNHGQPAGFVETTAENEHLAECFVAVCRKT